MACRLNLVLRGAFNLYDPLGSTILSAMLLEVFLGRPRPLFGVANGESLPLPGPSHGTMFEMIRRQVILFNTRDHHNTVVYYKHRAGKPRQA